MKRFILVLMFSLFLFPTASAQVMRQLNVTVDVQEDGLSDIEISFRFTEEIKEIYFPFPADIIEIETKYGECEVKEGIKNILYCKPPSPFMIGEVTITTNFKSTGLTERQGNITYFSFDIPILWKTDKALVIVKLPEGMVLSDKVPLPISPSDVDQRFDGRRILAAWSFRNKKTGDLLPIRIYYESLTPKPVQYFVYEGIAVLVVILVIGIIIIYRKLPKKAELVLSVLNEGERMIIDIIRKEGKEKVDQRKVVAASGFSKAKVSRIISNLEGRGVIKVERVGRRNRISLKKIIFKE